MTTIFSINAEAATVQRFRDLATRTGQTQRELFDRAVELVELEYSYMDKKEENA